MKPSVKIKCVANAYTGPEERIVEFSAKTDHGLVGGLISLRINAEGALVVNVYNVDPGVIVNH
jgi:hypothetical protein